MSHLDIAIQLITDERQIDASNTEECVNLMKEFLRREALWAKQLCLTEEIPFANLASATSKISSSQPFLEPIKKFAYSVAESRCCAAMLNWYGAIDESHIGKQDLPDPYQPLLRFFRLGGTFDREHRVFIQVNGTAVVQANTIQQGDLSKPFTSTDE